MSSRSWGDEPDIADGLVGHISPLGRVAHLARRLTDPSGDAVTATYGDNPNHLPGSHRVALAGAIYASILLSRKS